MGIQTGIKGGVGYREQQSPGRGLGDGSNLWDYNAVPCGGRGGAQPGTWRDGDHNMQWLGFLDLKEGAEVLS